MDSVRQTPHHKIVMSVRSLKFEALAGSFYACNTALRVKSTAPQIFSSESKLTAKDNIFLSLVPSKPHGGDIVYSINANTYFQPSCVCKRQGTKSQRARQKQMARQNPFTFLSSWGKASGLNGSMSIVVLSSLQSYVIKANFKSDKEVLYHF